MNDTTFVVDTNAPIGAISPRLYGHFAEHLGRCCYDGLFCDSESAVPHENGFRKDVLAALRGLPVGRGPRARVRCRCTVANETPTCSAIRCGASPTDCSSRIRSIVFREVYA